MQGGCLSGADPTQWCRAPMAPWYPLVSTEIYPQKISKNATSMGKMIQYDINIYIYLFKNNLEFEIILACEIFHRYVDGLSPGSLDSCPED